MTTSIHFLQLRDGASKLLLRDGASRLLSIDPDQLHFPGVEAGSSISGGTFSRGRWRKIVEDEEKARQAARDERERERKSRIEAKRKSPRCCRGCNPSRNPGQARTGRCRTKTITGEQRKCRFATTGHEFLARPEFKAPALRTPPPVRRPAPVAAPPVEAPTPHEALLQELIARQPELRKEANNSPLAKRLLRKGRK